MDKFYASCVKRLAVLLTCVLMLLVFANFNVTEVSAATTYTEGALEYVIEDNSITIIGYFGKDKTVTVPDSIGGIPVNTIREGAFSGTKATKVNLPSSVITIEAGAFSAGTSIVSNYKSDGSETYEAGDSGQEPGGGTDFSDVKKDDEVVIGGKKLKVIKKSKKKVVFEDADGRTYHTNGGYVIDDETNEQLEGDVQIFHKGGMDEEYAEVDLGELEEDQGVSPVVVVITIVVVIAAAAFFIIRKIRNRDDY